jgi:hypothetical protein
MREVVGFELRAREKAADFGLKHYIASSEAFGLILLDIMC